MTTKGRIGNLAFATRIAQKLTGPAEAILGFQALLIDEVHRNGPSGALEDLPQREMWREIPSPHSERRII